MNLESTVGMESMFDKVWRLINSTDDKPPVSNIIGLYGQGGVGKTTLLEKMNNEFHNKISTGEHGFDYVVIFVVVSKPVNYEAIQKKLGERLGLSDLLKEDGDEDSRAEKIFNALRNKNYVLLLDDIWEDQFDKKRIGIPIHPQGNSKLIFTTRSERVCGLMEATHTFQVECLPWDKAWSLFQDKVGEKVGELQYLNLSGTSIKELPVELKKLVKLKFLVLFNTYMLRRIPAGVIANLSELQVLDLGCDPRRKWGNDDDDDDNYFGVQNWELEDGPSFSELGDLKQLQQVRITISTNVALEKFLCNRKLQMVCTGLSFRSSSRRVSSSSRRVLYLTNFKSLKHLELISGFSELEKIVLYGSTVSALESLTLVDLPKLKAIRYID